MAWLTVLAVLCAAGRVLSTRHTLPVRLKDNAISCEAAAQAFFPQEGWYDSFTVSAGQTHVLYHSRFMDLEDDSEFLRAIGDAFGGFYSIDALIEINPLDRNCDITPLILACLRGDLPLVNRLLRLGASINLHAGGGETALTAAAWAGHCNIIPRLLAGGARIDLRNDRGRNAVLTAELLEREDCMRLLCEASEKHDEDEIEPACSQAGSHVAAEHIESSTVWHVPAREHKNLLDVAQKYTTEHGGAILFEAILDETLKDVGVSSIPKKKYSPAFPTPASPCSRDNATLLNECDSHKW